jgi:hypothetical protein
VDPRERRARALDDLALGLDGIALFAATALQDEKSLVTATVTRLCALGVRAAARWVRRNG